MTKPTVDNVVQHLWTTFNYLECQMRRRGEVPRGVLRHTRNSVQKILKALDDIMCDEEK